MATGAVRYFVGAVTYRSELLRSRQARQRVSGWQFSRCDAFDRLVEDDDGNVVRVALVVSIEWVSVPVSAVGLVSGLVGGVECHSDTRCSLIAVCGGKENS